MSILNHQKSLPETASHLQYVNKTKSFCMIPCCNPLQINFVAERVK